MISKSEILDTLLSNALIAKLNIIVNKFNLSESVEGALFVDTFKLAIKRIQELEDFINET